MRKPHESSKPCHGNEVVCEVMHDTEIGSRDHLQVHAYEIRRQNRQEEPEMDVSLTGEKQERHREDNHRDQIFQPHGAVCDRCMPVHDPVAAGVVEEPVNFEEAGRHHNQCETPHEDEPAKRDLVGNKRSDSEEEETQEEREPHRHMGRCRQTGFSNISVSDYVALCSYPFEFFSDFVLRFD